MAVHEDAARITQRCDALGPNTKPYFKKIHAAAPRAAAVHAEEHAELADATDAMLQMNPKGAADRLVSFFSRHQ